MKQCRYALFFIITIMNLFSFTSCALARDISISNSNYLVSKEGNALIVVNLNSYDIYEQQLEFPFELLEISSAFPFISIRSKITGIWEYYIYDISKNKLYKMGNDLDALDGRWSPSGKYTYSSSDDSFILIPTLKLVHYLETKSGDDIIQIKGHPLGQVAQQRWIGNQLLYISGIGESGCWGIVSPDTKKNYFITCCGFAKNTKYSEQCNFDKDTAELIISDWIAMIKSNKLRVISYDFYDEVLRITSEEEKTP